jgi:4'-phosphopantetheinyl transferase
MFRAMRTERQDTNAGKASKGGALPLLSLGSLGRAAPTLFGSRMPRVTLPAKVATIWWLEISAVPEQCWSIWTGVLDTEEQARAFRFVRESDRRQFIAAHTLLRAMLRRYGDQDSRAWRFVTGPNGKPSVHPDHGVPRLHFNISHAPGAVACGLVLDHPIGVDIEDRGRPGSHLHLADHYFAPSEVAQLRAEESGAQNALFFLFWTLKEAYIKATGTGLATPLDQFAFLRNPIRIQFGPELADDPAAWQFHSLTPTARHTLSLAIRHHGTGDVATMSREVGHREIEQLTARAECGVNTDGLP